ncbi:MAG TPA: LTA synthase family protein, partial [Bacteroidales bacterium]|nr:LTA synthase family protein [Bacteroidales bacterium]
MAGLKFDIAAICMINLPWIFFQIIPFNFRFNKLYQKINNILFLFVNGIAIFINCIDVAYFDYTIKRTTADIFITKGLAKDVIHLLPTFLIDFWYILLLAFLLILAMIYLNNFFTKTLKKLNNTFISFIIQFSLAIFFLILTVIGGRGGIQLRPLNIISAGKYTQAKNIPLVINTPFAILNTLGKHSIKKYNFYNEKELNEIFYPIKTVKTNLKFKNYNIVIIILEGFSSEHIGFLNKHLDNGSYKGYTPFLDSLMEHSVVFTNAYANGKKSNEGIAAIIAGIPSLMDVPYSSSIYAGNNIEGIGTLLKKKGYNTSFFHGGNNGTMGFDAFTKTAGFDKYYGKNEYPGNDYDGNWGIWDEEYLQYYANMLDKMEQPFLSAVFTLSSHHPFKIPSKYEGKFLKGPLPIHQTIQYTDFALKKFFNTISSKSWFENTIFILTADHTSEAYFPYYKT